jgi:hypothetical protein
VHALSLLLLNEYFVEDSGVTCYRYLGISLAKCLSVIKRDHYKKNTCHGLHPRIPSNKNDRYCSQRDKKAINLQATFRWLFSEPHPLYSLASVFLCPSVSNLFSDDEVTLANNPNGKRIVALREKQGVVINCDPERRATIFAQSFPW